MVGVTGEGCSDTASSAYLRWDYQDAHREQNWLYALLAPSINFKRLTSVRISQAVAGMEIAMTTESLCMAGALSVASLGAFTDLRTRRIPNRLTYAGMLTAIAGKLVLQGWHGLGSALAGGLIGGGAFFLLFLIHAMGAGDVKLIAAVGCFAGPAAAVQIVLATAIAGGILAVLYSLWQGRLRVVLVNVWELIRFHALAGAEVHPTLNLSNPRASRLPYGTAIAAGVLYSVLVLYCRGEI